MEIKKRWQEYTEELYKYGLKDPDIHNGVAAHLKPDILECEVKWALGSITTNKASGGDWIPAELVLKDDAVKVLHLIWQKIWKTQQWPQDCKRSVFIPVPKKFPLPNIQSTVQLCPFYMLARLSSKSFKRELPDVQAGFQRNRGTKDQTANICGIMEKSREFQKNIYFWFIDYVKAFGCVDHNKLWKILQEMGIPDYLTCLLRNLYVGQETIVRTGHGTMDWFKIGKGAW